MITHQNDMHREEDTTNVAGPAPDIGRTLRTASRRSPVSYAFSYPAAGRYGAGLGRRLFPDGRPRASIQWKRPEIRFLWSVDGRPSDAASGPGICQDFAGVDLNSLSVPRENRIHVTTLGMCSTLLVEREAFLPSVLDRRSCSEAPFRR